MSDPSREAFMARYERRTASSKRFTAANRERLSATMDANKAIQNSDASFVIVPTPSDSTGFFSNRFVLQAMETLGIKH